MVLHCLFFTIFLFAAPCVSYDDFTHKIDYSKYCNHIVHESPIDDSHYSFKNPSAENLNLQSAYFSGGRELLGQNPNSNTDVPNFVNFYHHSTHKTLDNGTHFINGDLTFQTPYNFIYRKEGSTGLRVRGPRYPVQLGMANFKLTGFWSVFTGKLCMVGTGSSFSNAKTGNLGFFKVVLKINYPVNYSSVHDSLVKGVLESADDSSSGSFFEPISILGLSETLNYDYKLVGNGSNECLGSDEGDRLSLDSARPGFCMIFRRPTPDKFELEYNKKDCENKTCNLLGSGSEILPNFMFFKGTRCTEDKKMQMLLGFHNSSSYYGNQFHFNPHSTLIAEGVWDGKKNQLCGVACRILNFTESLAGAFVGNCSIKLNLGFPAVLSLRNRSKIVGSIHSEKTSKEDQGHFAKIAFRSLWGEPLPLRGLKYVYAEMDTVRKLCPSGNIRRSKGKTYPGGFSQDLRFQFSVKNSKRKLSRGQATPFFVGDQLSTRSFSWHNNLIVPNHKDDNLLNISYSMAFTASSDPLEQISAEGIYDKNTGVLCMIGCKNSDCMILINIEFPPLNPERGESIKGTIKSTRVKSDPLYFEVMEISSSSIYTKQAKETIWRMDIEIAMILISNTLACVFLGLQLIHVTKHRDVLPWISIFMLLVLTLGHMIPLLLNFQALYFIIPSKQAILLGNDGWLEVNEITIRVVKMVAFLLQFRILQLAWSSKQSDSTQTGFWNYEKKVSYACFPFYIMGGLIFLLVHYTRNSHRRNLYRVYDGQHDLVKLGSLWDDMKSYGGLILDGFLVPQILFNVFANSREKALTASFYIGTTFVRILPHAYDLYRAHKYALNFELSYLYANHKMDLYSTYWDVIIPCAGLLLALLVFLQQRYGGRCIIVSKRFRDQAEYQKVDVICSEELQEL